MADKIYEVEPIYDVIDEDGERRRLPRNEVVLTKQQLSRFAARAKSCTAMTVHTAVHRMRISF